MIFNKVRLQRQTMDLLKGRIALVTGSTKGLGRVIAENLAKEGANVIINGRNKETVEKVRMETQRISGKNIYCCVADATDTKQITKYFNEVHQSTHGKLDILVNNVGNIEKFGSFTELTDDEWLRCYDRTFMSVVRFTREALPFLKTAGGGKIINISTIISRQPGSFPQYSAAKAAVENLTKYLANIYAKENILVTGIRASALKSGAWHLIVKDRAESQNISTEKAEEGLEKDEANKSPLKRMATLQNIADAVTFLASHKADYMTGEIINIDGGITRGI